MRSRDIESAYLDAKAQAEQWTSELLAEWYRDEADLMLIMFWANLDPMVRIELETRQPDAYRQVEEAVRAARERLQQGG